MKILLVGEFSGFHSELKKGLSMLGHDVTILAAGDGWKDIKCDIKIPTGNTLIAKIFALFAQYHLVRSLSKYDVVQFIYPHIFNRHVNSHFISLLIKQNKSSYLVAAGSDAFYWKGFENRFRYSPHLDSLSIDAHGIKPDCCRRWFRLWNRRLALSVDAIIPAAYDYRIGYSEFDNVAPTIPMPISVVDYSARYFDPRSSKIVLFHGISRVGFKGTKYILAALNKLKAKYGDHIDVVCPERLPYDQYIQKLYSADIVIDQALSYSFGINALISASMGKVTLSGAEPECLNELQLDNCPIINITPSVDDIIAKLELLLKNRSLIARLSRESRLYVENVHEAKAVASRFVATWCAYASQKLN